MLISSVPSWCVSRYICNQGLGLIFRELSPLRIAATIHAQRFAVVSQQVNLPGGVASPSELQLASTLQYTFCDTSGVMTFARIVQVVSFQPRQQRLHWGAEAFLNISWGIMINLSRVRVATLLTSRKTETHETHETCCINPVYPLKSKASCGTVFSAGESNATITVQWQMQVNVFLAKCWNGMNCTEFIKVLSSAGGPANRPTWPVGVLAK